MPKLALALCESLLTQCACTAIQSIVCTIDHRKACILSHMRDSKIYAGELDDVWLMAHRKSNDVARILGNFCIKSVKVLLCTCHSEVFSAQWYNYFHFQPSVVLIQRVL